MGSGTETRLEQFAGDSEHTVYMLNMPTNVLSMVANTVVTSYLLMN